MQQLAAVAAIIHLATWPACFLAARSGSIGRPKLASTRIMLAKIMLAKTKGGTQLKHKRWSKPTKAMSAMTNIDKIAITIVALSPWVGTGDKHAGWLVYPIIFCLAFGDPSMGEARRMGLNKEQVYAIGTIVCAICWLVCGYLFGTPYWMAIFMAPLTMAAELPKLRWIDDNATMVLIPLVAVLFTVPFL